MADIDLVRSLIPDTDQVFGENEDEYLFADAEINNYIAIGGGSVLRAAGFAVYALATSEALISKVIKSQDLSTNGAQVSDTLIKKADALFKQAAAIDAAGDEFGFQIINYGDGWNLTAPELVETEWV